MSTACAVVLTANLAKPAVVAQQYLEEKDPAMKGILQGMRGISFTVAVGVVAAAPIFLGQVWTCLCKLFCKAKKTKKIGMTSPLPDGVLRPQSLNLRYLDRSM